MRPSLNRLVFGLLSAALLAQALKFALQHTWSVALGVLLLGAVLGRLASPRLRGHPYGVTWAHLANSAVVLGTLGMESQATDMLCMVSNLIVLTVLGDDEWPGLRRRLRDRLRERGFRFTRPVIAPLG